MNTLLTAIAWALLIGMGAIIIFYTVGDGSLKWMIDSTRRSKHGRIRK